MWRSRSLEAMARLMFVLAIVAAAGGCAHPSGSAMNSRTELGDALRARGFLAPDAPPGTTYNGALLAFQKSEGLPQTGYPDPATLRALGIDPATVDDSLSPRGPPPADSQAAGLH
jgi:hypothetical protein